MGLLGGATPGGNVSQASEPRSAGIWLVAPEDGGTPRDAQRIEAVGPGEFRIRACEEEGSGVLTHAVSRVDLICRNDGAEPQTVTLHLDLSGDGRRTNADNNAFGGMSTRDFLFIQAPGQPWRQIEGLVSGWVCTVRFSAPPGETRVGLSPRYTYGDYLRFIQTLPHHAHLEKTRLGLSDGGREHWELTITDPNVPAEDKRAVFWHAREQFLTKLVNNARIRVYLRDHTPAAVLPTAAFVCTHATASVSCVLPSANFTSPFSTRACRSR